MPRLPHLFSHRLACRLLAPCALLLAAGCGSVGTPAAPGTVLFQDDFSRSSSGWVRRTAVQSILGYDQGRYKMLVLSPESDALSTPGLDLANVHIEVDALKLSGPLDNRFGILCGLRDADNYAFFVISSDGFAGIGEVRDGQRAMLSADTMLPAPSVAPDGYANRLGADCQGTHLRLWVNGTLAEEAEADSPTRGDVGLLVGTYEEPGAEIVFDNFTVLQLESGDLP